MKVRPALSKTFPTPPHARHMEPSCTEGSHADSVNPVSTTSNAWLPLLSVYVSQMVSICMRWVITLSWQLPYMSWMTFGQHAVSAQTENDARSLSGNVGSIPPGSRAETHGALIPRNTLVTSEQDATLHPRRTLDQFYYPALNDTRIRDADQTISKWSGNDVPADGKAGASNDSLLIIVDQLWCWVVDQGSALPLNVPCDISMNANVNIRYSHIKLPILLHSRWSCGVYRSL
jgi:hypothetical protein